MATRTRSCIGSRPCSLPDEPITHTSVYVPKRLLLALRTKLLAEGKSLSQWVREQAEAYLQR